MNNDLVNFERDIEGISESALAGFVTRARQAVGLKGRVNVLVTTNRQMRDLNRRFRQKDKPTDVLSFPAPEELGNKLAGDIAISAQIAEENATALGHGVGVELKVLVLHGLLHLAGYDHESDDGRMARREVRLRRELKLPESLIERAGLGSRARRDSHPPLKGKGAAPDLGDAGRKAGPSTARRKSAAPLGMTGSMRTAGRTSVTTAQRGKPNSGRQR